MRTPTSDFTKSSRFMVYSSLSCTLRFCQSGKPAFPISMQMQFAPLDRQEVGSVEAELHPTSLDLQHDDLDVIAHIHSFTGFSTEEPTCDHLLVMRLFQNPISANSTIAACQPFLAASSNQRLLSFGSPHANPSSCMA